MPMMSDCEHAPIPMCLPTRVPPGQRSSRKTMTLSAIRDNSLRRILALCWLSYLNTGRKRTESSAFSQPCEAWQVNRFKILWSL